MIYYKLLLIEADLNHVDSSLKEAEKSIKKK